MALRTLDDVDPRVFRTGWRRFLAVWIDSLLLGVVEYFVLLEQLDGHPLIVRAVAFVIDCFVALSYSIILHARFGQTLGKWLMRVRIVALDLGPITWFQAVARESPWIVLTVVQLIMGVTGFVHGRLGRAYGLTLLILGAAGLVWTLLELVTMLTNSRRRALHDFLARTLVVRVGKDRSVAKMRWATT